MPKLLDTQVAIGLGFVFFLTFAYYTFLWPKIVCILSTQKVQ